MSTHTLTHTHIYTAQAQSGVKEVTFPALSVFLNKHQYKYQHNNQAISQTPGENMWYVEKSGNFQACPSLMTETL